VPLDPEYPQQRLDYLVQDSGMSAVLAEERLAPRLSGRGLPVIGVPSSAEAGSAPAVETVRRGPDDLVYVIYTSGSTGLPKGVRVTEANVVNLLNAVGESYKLTEGDVTIFTHSFTFDASVLEIFAPLAFGAKLVVAAADERRDAAKLVAAVKRHGVTIWDMVPAMLAQVVDLPDFAADCASLRLAISGADVLPPGLAHRFLTLAPWCELQNQYGPTEATVITTVWSCTTDAAAGPVPIGFPIAGTSVHLLDDRLAPVEPGEIGEIHIGGAGVTAGYHGRPELTGERFVTGPDGMRLYRTGGEIAQRAAGQHAHHARRGDAEAELGRGEPDRVQEEHRPAGEPRALAQRQRQRGEVDRPHRPAPPGRRGPARPGRLPGQPAQHGSDSLTAAPNRAACAARSPSTRDGTGWSSPVRTQCRNVGAAQVAATVRTVAARSRARSIRFTLEYPKLRASSAKSVPEEGTRWPPVEA
jgi:amino acid adenylation domain-containing protein